VKKYIINTGWRLDPKPTPYIAYISEEETNPVVKALKPDSSITIVVPEKEPKFCIGYTNSNKEHLPCPTAEIVPLNKIQCQNCAFNEFFICRSYCIGEFCQPSSDAAKDYCWNKTAYVYLTYITGKLKVGSSVNPFRRWLDQGSDAGITIASGAGLDPRGLEHLIATRFSLSLAIRLTEKYKQLGTSFNKEEISKLFAETIDKIYSESSTKTLFPKEELEPIRFLDEFHGLIPSLDSRPIVKTLSEKGLKFSGKIVGVKGSILVVRNNNTNYATNLDSLIGMHIELNEEIIEMKGQKSLFDFI
jgi:hypothetical protein